MQPGRMRYVPPANGAGTETVNERALGVGRWALGVGRWALFAAFPTFVAIKIYTEP